MSIEVGRSREEYRRLCAGTADLPLFSQDWWLDAVAEKQWSAVIAKKNGVVVGTLPYLLLRKWGFTLITQPKLTQTLGPWILETDRSYPKRLAYEKDVMGALVKGLPRAAYYSQNWHSSRENWLPFYWLGFTQSTRYTYRLDRANGQDALWKGMQENIRREIRKAENRFQISVRRIDLETFLRLNQMTFDRQKKQVPYTNQLVRRIHRAASERNASDCLMAYDTDDRPHAGVYVVRDADTAYYLLGGSDPSLRTSGAVSLALWWAICSQPEHIRYFDFEGSMIEPIERFFRAFGAVQVPYFSVSKVDSRALRLALCLRRFTKGSFNRERA